MSHVETSMSDGNVAEVLKAELAGLKTEISEVIAQRGDESDAKLREELDSKVKGLSDRIAGLEQVQEQSAAYETPGIELDDNGDRPGKAFSWARFVKGMCMSAKGQRINGGDPFESKELGYEGEYLKGMQDKLHSGKIERATYAGATDATGGYLVGTDVQSGILDLLREQSTAYGAGVRRMDGAVGNLAWIRNLGGTTGYWVDTEAEESITQSESTFTQVTARPHPLAALSKISWLMMKQPSESVEAFIRQEIATVLALKESAAIYSGSGASGEPRGILNSGISTHADTVGGFGTANDATAANAKLISNNLRSMPQALRTNKALGLPGAKYAFVGENAICIDIEQAVDSDGKHMFLRDDAAMADTLFRYPLICELGSDFEGTSSDRTLLFGDFNQCVVPHWGAMEFDASDSDDDDFKKARMTVRAITALDVAVLQPNAFVEMTGYDD